MTSFKDFILANEGTDTAKLLMSEAGPVDGVDLKTMVNTLTVRRKLKTKVPSWYAFPELIYPSSLSGEQCSSEATAMFKAGLCRRIMQQEDFNIADLTGGIGVDSWAFSKVASQVLYNEMNMELATCTAQNFVKLGADNITVRNSKLVPAADAQDPAAGLQAKTAAEILNGFRPDIIFLDPARRDDAGNKVFLLEDCRPDLLKLKDELLSLSRHLLVKLSPMADIDMIINRIGQHCREIHALSYGGDCRELLLHVDRDWTGDCSYVASTPDSSLEFTAVERKSAVAAYLDDESQLSPGTLLFEPGKSLMKLGVFNAICQKTNLIKLGISTHYYVAPAFSPMLENTDTIITTAFGKVFLIEEVLPLNNANLKTIGNKYPNADVTARNLPMNTETMRKKLFPATKKSRADAKHHIFGLHCDFSNGKSANYLIVALKK